MRIADLEIVSKDYGDPAKSPAPKAELLTVNFAYNFTHEGSDVRKSHDPLH